MTDNERHRERSIASITHEKITWVRWEGGQSRISHPYVYTWRDETGYERVADTRGEALTQIATYYAD